jgi:hypothetical protein
MANPSTRGSACDRGRPDDLRTGDFKRGDEKRGGRKRGTPNAFSFDYKRAILETAYRIGEDGNGKNGIVGYFSWVGERHPRVYCNLLLTNILPLEFAEIGKSRSSAATMEEISESVRGYIGLADKRQPPGQTSQAGPPLPCGWTGQPFPVGSLMQTAVDDPKSFCTLIAAAFLRPPTIGAAGRRR